MSQPVACRPNYPTHPEHLDPDVIVDLAANLARVDRNCTPVDTLGPSFEKLRRDQREAVSNPVNLLMQSVSEESAGVLALKAVALVQAARTWVGRAQIVEDTLALFVQQAVVEGKALQDARVRDAKVTVFLSLAAGVLPAEFLASALRARQAGRGEALAILNQIDAQPGLRATLERDVERAVTEGIASAEAFGLGSHENLRALLGRAEELMIEQGAGKTLSEFELGIIDFIERFESDTGFRIGVYAEIWLVARERSAAE